MKDWNYQKTASDCGLCALSNVFLYKGIEFDYDMAVSSLRMRGLELLGYSGFFLYLPLIAADCGLSSTVFLPVNHELISPLLKNGAVSDERLVRIMEQSFASRNALYFFYKSLKQVLEERDKIKICYGKLDLRKERSTGRAILANVTAEEFYQMPCDRTNHIVTLIPQEEGYQVVDPYRVMGYQEFDKWDEYIAASKRYDWSGFRNFVASF